MTAVDGDPLTGDPTAADVRHVLDVIHAAPVIFPLHRAPDLIPLIHEACGLDQCGGCSSRGCVSRRPGPTPLPLPTWDATGRRIRGTGPNLWDLDGRCD